MVNEILRHEPSDFVPVQGALYTHQWGNQNIKILLDDMYYEIILSVMHYNSALTTHARIKIFTTAKCCIPTLRKKIDCTD